MRFGVYAPPHPGPRPVLWCLAGLTCNEETFAIKAGAQRFAADFGLILVTPDTSPRGEEVADDVSWDMGQAASFYLDATESPWAPYFQMATWLLHELPAVVASVAPADLTRQSITGHSMGGHGALTLALKTPGRFRSVSAFAPIVAPTQVPWGQRRFLPILGKIPLHGQPMMPWSSSDLEQESKNCLLIKDLQIIFCPRSCNRSCWRRPASAPIFRLRSASILATTIAIGSSRASSRIIFAGMRTVWLDCRPATRRAPGH